MGRTRCALHGGMFVVSGCLAVTFGSVVLAHSISGVGLADLPPQFAYCCEQLCSRGRQRFMQRPSISFSGVHLKRWTVCFSKKKRSHIHWKYFLVVECSFDVVSHVSCQGSTLFEFVNKGEMCVKTVQTHRRTSPPRRGQMQCVSNCWWQKGRVQFGDFRVKAKLRKK